MNLREYGREGNLETSAPSLTGIFYMQGEEYSMKKSGVLGLAVLLALAGGTAHAADVYEMEGIVVTATKMAESAEKCRPACPWSRQKRLRITATKA